MGNANAAYPGTATAANGRVYVENGLFSTASGAREVYIEINRISAASTINGTYTIYIDPVVTGPTNGRLDLWRFFAAGTLVSQFTLRNSNENLVSEPGNSHGAITVAAWITKNSWTDCGGRSISYTGSNPIGAIAPFSGPRPDARRPPEAGHHGSGNGNRLGALLRFRPALSRRSELAAQ